MKTEVQEYQDKRGEARIRTISAENGNKLVAVTQGYSDMGYAEKAMIRSAVAILEKYKPVLLHIEEVAYWKATYSRQ